MKIDKAAQKVAAIAVDVAQKACDDKDISWTELATVLEKCSNVISGQRFGPEGGAYHYRQWVGYHPPGFTNDSDRPVAGE